MSPTAHRIGGRPVPGRGSPLRGTDPVTGRVNWTGHCATPEEVDEAVGAAREAFRSWRRLALEARWGVIETYGRAVAAHSDELAAAITSDTGKPRWEARAEAAAVVGKLDLTRSAWDERARCTPLDLGGSAGRVVRAPHGVIAVLGPFNLPAHLPNGQIIPALLAGNTVVFKPSELAPLTAAVLARLWDEAQGPAGVLNVVFGDGGTGRALADHPEIDGLFFTGSYATGRALHRAFGGHPEKVLALEMGGNNPLVVWDAGDIRAVVLQSLLSAFVTAGQRCTCARRLILPTGPDGDRVLDALLEAAKNLRIGPPEGDPEPFMGPLITPAAALAVLHTQHRLAAAGARVLVEAASPPEGPAFLTPGILDVTPLADRPDTECFGPLLQVIRVPDFDTAVAEARRTRYGLAAGILTDRPDRFEQFRDQVDAGVIHWNRPTTGASGRLPFGGRGRSGNHRPAGYFTVDACADPVAVQESPTLLPPEPLPPGLVPHGDPG